MITLCKNMDKRQVVKFADLPHMCKAIKADPYAYDGLTLFRDKQNDEDVINLVFDEHTYGWDVEVFPESWIFTGTTLDEALQEFTELLQKEGLS